MGAERTRLGSGSWRRACVWRRFCLRRTVSYTRRRSYRVCKGGWPGTVIAAVVSDIASSVFPRFHGSATGAPINACRECNGPMTSVPAATRTLRRATHPLCRASQGAALSMPLKPVFFLLLTLLSLPVCQVSYHQSFRAAASRFRFGARSGCECDILVQQLRVDHAADSDRDTNHGQIAWPTHLLEVDDPAKAASGGCHNHVADFT